MVEGKEQRLDEIKQLIEGKDQIHSRTHRQRYIKHKVYTGLEFYCSLQSIYITYCAYYYCSPWGGIKATIIFMDMKNHILEIKCTPLHRQTMTIVNLYCITMYPPLLFYRLLSIIFIFFKVNISLHNF